MANEQKIVTDESVFPFPTFCWRIIAAHMIAYLIAASIAQIYYRPVWDTGIISSVMRPMNSPMVALGPALQSINAFFIAVILFPLRTLIINRKNGWITLLLLVAGFSIFTPQAPAPGTFEGFLYTKFSLFEHLIGLPECLIYSFLFSTGFFQWYKNPKKIWNIISIVLIVLICCVSTLGYLAAIGIIKQP
jgi:hypothetical protein